MSEIETKLPQPDELSKREKEDAMGAYFMMFAAWGIGLPLPVLNLIAAAIYYFINKKNSRFAAFHSLQSLLSQIPVTVVNFVLVVWLIEILVIESTFPDAFFIYLIFMVFANVFYLVFSVIALTRARKGQFYYMPFFGRVAFNRFYGPKAAPLQKPVEPNRPPEGL